MNYFSNYCLFLIYTHWLEEIHDYHRPFRHSAFLISVMNLLKSLHSLISFFLVQILWACYDIQQASIFTHFLTLNSSVFLNQFNVWLLSHHKSCSCTYKPVALVRLQKVLNIHYQQNEILVWSTSSKNRVLKFVIHKKKKRKIKIKPPKLIQKWWITTEVTLDGLPKTQKIHTNTSNTVSPLTGSPVHDQRSRGQPRKKPRGRGSLIGMVCRTSSRSWRGLWSWTSIQHGVSLMLCRG